MFPRDHHLHYQLQLRKTRIYVHIWGRLFWLREGMWGRGEQEEQWWASPDILYKCIYGLNSWVDSWHPELLYIQLYIFLGIHLLQYTVFCISVYMEWIHGWILGIRSFYSILFYSLVYMYNSIFYSVKVYIYMEWIHGWIPGIRSLLYLTIPWYNSYYIVSALIKFIL